MKINGIEIKGTDDLVYTLKNEFDDIRITNENISLEGKEND